MAYRLRTLGSVALMLDGAPLDGVVAQHRRLALLSLIASGGRCGISRDRLMGLLWPDSDPLRARQSLTQWLHMIRRDLGDDVLLGIQELRLNPDRISCDVSELIDALEQGVLEQGVLEQGALERAAALYAGPFLDGFYLNRAPDFGRWVEEERARLAARMREVYDALVRGASLRGDVAGAVRWAERLAALDPLDGTAALTLVRALGDAGDGARAVRHADLHATLLRTELEVEPSEAIVALAERLRQMPTPVRASVRARDPSSGTAPAATPAPTALPPAPARRWKTGAAGAAGLVLALIVVAAATRGVADDGAGSPAARARVLVLPFDNATGDTALDAVGQMAADWIVRGVGETGLLDVAASPAGRPSHTDPTLAARAAAAGAGTIIAGRFYRQGDSLAFHLQIREAATERVLGTVGPVISSRDDLLGGVEVLRRRTMGSIGVLVDQRFAPLGHLVSAPPSYEAFRAVQEGDAASRRRLHGEAADHYRRAIQLDSSYLHPVVQLTRVSGNAFDCGRVDSLVGALAPRRAQLTEFERLVIDRELQTCRGQLLAAYGTAKQLLALAPESPPARLYLARNAAALNRPREALAVLMPGGRPPAPEASLTAYNLGTFALHSLGEHQRELDLARLARARYPDLLEPLHNEGRARAALRDLDGVREVVATSLRLEREAAPNAARAWRPTDVLLTIVHELRAHGEEAEAQRLALELRDWLLRHAPAQGDHGAEGEYLTALFTTYQDLAQWDAARGVAARLAARHGDRLTTLAARGRLAAATGDAPEAERIADSLALREGPWLRGQHTYVRAQIAALLGQREQAVQLLRDALAEGVWYDSYRAPRTRSFCHTVPEFRGLRGYPPYEELLRPRG